jgi:organic radical activating enzyme
MLQVKEIFGPTIQGEGECAGMPALFIRFTGCNIWSGKPEEKIKSACPYCDTDFVGGEEYTPEQILTQVSILNQQRKQFLIVFTGGEPLLQNSVDLTKLCQLLRSTGLYQIQIETNGTINKNNVLENFDYIICSPKLPMEKLKIDFKYVTSWKMLYPHPTVKLEPFIEMAGKNHKREVGFYLQPIDEGTELQKANNIRKTVEKIKVLGYPWRLSLQIHKIVGEK